MYFIDSTDNAHRILEKQQTKSITKDFMHVFWVITKEGFASLKLENKLAI